LRALTTLVLLLLLLGSKSLAVILITHSLLISLKRKVKIPNSDLLLTLQTRKVNLSTPGLESNSLISLFLPKEPHMDFVMAKFGPPHNTLILQPVQLVIKPFSLIPFSLRPLGVTMTIAEVKVVVSFTTLPTGGTSLESNVMINLAIISWTTMWPFMPTLWDFGMFLMQVRLDTSWQ
jgi:hypothetical protein